MPKYIFHNSKLIPKRLLYYKNLTGPVYYVYTFSEITPVSLDVYFCKRTKSGSCPILNGLNEKYQSAYKQLHSTETALVFVANDILRSVDEKKVVWLVLLDLSAAFDTVDQDVSYVQVFRDSGHVFVLVQIIFE